MDIFQNKINCGNCNTEMVRSDFVRDGFRFRVLKCFKCHNQIIHPEDEQEYKRYKCLKNKKYSVKLRIIGNSYAVSIPKEIVTFINEQNKIINEMVRLNFDRMGRLSLLFNEEEETE
jgi:hypothetical protein